MTDQTTNEPNNQGPDQPNQLPDGGATLSAPAEPNAGEPLAAPGEANLQDLSLGEAPAATTLAPEKPDAHGWWWGTGRRKSARARVRLKPGSGDFKIQIARNKFKTIDEYFTELRDRGDAVAPLKATKNEGGIDVVARLDGGGFMGQAQALRLGVARALKKYDPSLEGILRDNGYLTRDAREVERKKYGQPGARRKFQFSKR